MVIESVHGWTNSLSSLDALNMYRSKLVAKVPAHFSPKSGSTTESKIGYALLYKKETASRFLYSKLVFLWFYASWILRKLEVHGDLLPILLLKYKQIKEKKVFLGLRLYFWVLYMGEWYKTQQQ